MAVVSDIVNASPRKAQNVHQRVHRGKNATPSPISTQLTETSAATHKRERSSNVQSRKDSLDEAQKRLEARRNSDSFDEVQKRIEARRNRITPPT